MNLKKQKNILIMLTTLKIKSIFEIFKSQNPNPIAELDFVNDFTFLVAILLSAQATDKGVNKATPALFAVADSPKKMLELGLDDLKNYIKTIGLYNNKAKNIIALSDILVKEHGGKVPTKSEELEKLPGIGRKSANVFFNTIYKKPVIAVDTHVIRTSNIIGITTFKKPLEIEQDLYKKIPKEYHIHTSNWLVLHGRYICTAKKPKCDICPISKYCINAFNP